jgi:hypothetical protein
MLYLQDTEPAGKTGEEIWLAWLGGTEAEKGAEGIIK